MATPKKPSGEPSLRERRAERSPQRLLERQIELATREVETTLAAGSTASKVAKLVLEQFAIVTPDKDLSRTFAAVEAAKELFRQRLTHDERRNSRAIAAGIAVAKNKLYLAGRALRREKRDNQQIS